MFQNIIQSLLNEAIVQDTQVVFNTHTQTQPRSVHIRRLRHSSVLLYESSPRPATQTMSYTSTANILLLLYRFRLQIIRPLSYIKVTAPLARTFVMRILIFANILVVINTIVIHTDQ